MRTFLNRLLDALRSMDWAGSSKIQLSTASKGAAEFATRSSSTIRKSIVVDVINSSKKPRMPSSRPLLYANYGWWSQIANMSFMPTITNLAGEENRVADWLSRWHLGNKYK